MGQRILHPADLHEGPYYDTRTSPRLGWAAFENDQTPPDLNLRDEFGQVRWYEAGYNECPKPQVATQSVAPGRVRSISR